MCGTSKDCAKLCIWITPVTMCLVFATLGLSMVGACLFGMHFSNKAEGDFLPWKCKVTKTFEFRGNELREWIDAYPLGFSMDNGMEMKDDSYLRRVIFMTKTKNYTEENMEYICNLFGYNLEDYSVEEEHTIIWDVEKMKKFFATLFFCGVGFGLFGLFSYMLCWRVDNEGEVMHTKVKQIFFVLIFATAMFIAGVCGLAVDLFPYDNFANFTGGIMLGISLCYPCYCLWATCKVAEEVRLKPQSTKQRGQVHRRPGGENDMGTTKHGGFSTEGCVEGL